MSGGPNPSEVPAVGMSVGTRSGDGSGLPRIGISDGIEDTEIDEAIGAVVHHRERNRTAFHDQTLIHAFSSARGLEKPLAKTAVCARDSVPEERLSRPSYH